MLPGIRNMKGRGTSYCAQRVFFPPHFQKVAKFEYFLLLLFSGQIIKIRSSLFSILE